MPKQTRLKLIDLSQPLYHDCPSCPDNPPVRSEYLTDHPKDGWRVEQLCLTPHSGSHLDVPLHKLEGGPAIDAFPLDRFVGPAFILDLRDSRPRQPYTSTMLSRTLQGRADLKDKIILLATGWGEKRGKNQEWLEQSPFLSPDGASWLVGQEVRGVGIDHFSIGGVSEPTNALTHQRLLEANIWIAEDLRFPPAAFELVQPATFWCLPIHLQGCGGAFCRPVLVDGG